MTEEPKRWNRPFVISCVLYTLFMIALAFVSAKIGGHI